MKLKSQLNDDMNTLRAGNHKAIAKQYREMVVALRALQTLANMYLRYSGKPLLEPGDVIRLCEKALKRFKA